MSTLFQKLTSRLRTFSVFQKHRAVYGIFFGTCAITLFVLGTHTTLATMQEVLVWGAGLLTEIVLLFARLCMALTIFFLRFFIQLGAYNGFLDAPIVRLGWVMLRDIANMFFVIALLVIAFATILGRESYEWKKAMVKLVLVAILVNFSLLICGVILDAAHVFTITFINAIAPVAAGNLIAMFNFGDMLAILQDSGAVESNLAIALLGGAAAALFFSAMAALSVGAYCVILLFRMVSIWALLIFSPLAFVLSVLPTTENYFEEWKSEFSKNVLSAPIAVFFLWLAFATMGANSAVKHLNDFSSGYTFVDSTGSVNSVGQEVGGLNLGPGGETNPLVGQGTGNVSINAAATWANMAGFFVAVAFLLKGIEQVQSLGVMGSGWLDSAQSFAKSVVTIGSGYALGRWLVGKGAEGLHGLGVGAARTAYYQSGLARVKKSIPFVQGKFFKKMGARNEEIEKMLEEKSEKSLEPTRSVARRSWAANSSGLAKVKLEAESAEHWEHEEVRGEENKVREEVLRKNMAKQDALRGKIDNEQTKAEFDHKAEIAVDVKGTKDRAVADYLNGALSSGNTEADKALRKALNLDGTDVTAEKLGEVLAKIGGVDDNAIADNETAKALKKALVGGTNGGFSDAIQAMQTGAVEQKIKDTRKSLVDDAVRHAEHDEYAPSHGFGRITGAFKRFTGSQGYVSAEDGGLLHGIEHSLEVDFKEQALKNLEERLKNAATYSMRFREEAEMRKAKAKQLASFVQSSKAGNVLGEEIKKLKDLSVRDKEQQKKLKELEEIQHSLEAMSGAGEDHGHGHGSADVGEEDIRKLEKWLEKKQNDGDIGFTLERRRQIDEDAARGIAMHEATLSKIRKDESETDAKFAVDGLEGRFNLGYLSAEREETQRRMDKVMDKLLMSKQIDEAKVLERLGLDKVKSDGDAIRKHETEMDERLIALQRVALEISEKQLEALTKPGPQDANSRKNLLARSLLADDSPLLAELRDEIKKDSRFSTSVSGTAAYENHIGSLLREMLEKKGVLKMEKGDVEDAVLASAAEIERIEKNAQKRSLPITDDRAKAYATGKNIDLVSKGKEVTDDKIIRNARKSIALESLTSQERALAYRYGGVLDGMAKLSGEYFIKSQEKAMKKFKSESERMVARISDFVRGEEGKIMDEERNWNLQKSADYAKTFDTWDYNELENLIKQNALVIERLSNKEKQGDLSEEEKDNLNNTTQTQVQAMSSFIRKNPASFAGLLGVLGYDDKDGVTDSAQFEKYFMAMATGARKGAVDVNDANVFNALDNDMRRRLKEKEDPILYAAMRTLNEHALTTGQEQYYQQLAEAYTDSARRKVGFGNRLVAGVGGKGGPLGTGKVDQDGRTFRESQSENMIRKGIGLRNVKEIASLIRQNANGKTTGFQSEAALNSALEILTVNNRSLLEDYGQAWARRFFGGSFSASSWNGKHFDVTDEVAEGMDKLFKRFVDNATDSTASVQVHTTNTQNMRSLLKMLGVGGVTDKSTAAELASILAQAGIFGKNKNGTDRNSSAIDERRVKAIAAEEARRQKGRGTREEEPET